jgi:hypothetical protein
LLEKVDVTAASDIPPDIKQRVEEILRAEQIARYLPDCEAVHIKIEKVLNPGIPLVSAHSNWNPGYFERVACFPPFFCQELGSVTGQGVVRVAVECVSAPSGGMSSYYGFKGYFISLLVSLSEGRIWDARFEEAT